METFTNLEKYKLYVELLSRANNSYVFLTEYSNRFLYTSPNFNTSFRYDIEKLKDSLIEYNYLEKYIHPDDFLIFSTIQKRLLSSYYNQPIECRKDYKHIFEFRILNVKREYVRVISQYQVLEIDEAGNPFSVLGVVDLPPDQKGMDEIKFRLVNNKIGEMIPFPLTEKTGIKLIRREVGTLELVNKDMFSRKISDSLSVSVYTVNNHRQSILQKVSIDNAVEATSYT